MRYIEIVKRIISLPRTAEIGCYMGRAVVASCPGRDVTADQAFRYTVTHVDLALRYMVFHVSLFKS